MNSRILTALLFAAIPMIAETTPVINKVVVTPTAMIISGTHFGIVPPTVTVCGANALLLSNYDTEVTITSPVQAKTPGTCLLKLVNNTGNGNEDKRTVTFNVTIPTTQKAFAAKVDSSGAIVTSNSGIHSAKFAAGSYQITFPGGTWNFVFPPAVIVVPVSGVAPNLQVSSYSVGLDGSLSLIVSNNGVDINFFILAMQS